MFILFKLIFTVFALIGILNPKLTWQMSEGWKFKDAEPSEAYLVMTRITSVVVLIVVWIVIPGW